MEQIESLCKDLSVLLTMKNQGVLKGPEGKDIQIEIDSTEFLISVLKRKEKLRLKNKKRNEEDAKRLEAFKDIGEYEDLCRSKHFSRRLNKLREIDYRCLFE